MAGIYVHIPYCKTICHYCDFYKTANLKNIDDFVNALLIEIDLKKNLIQENINTIYLGGGTPSVLSFSQLDQLFSKIYKTFNISADAEITIEINPDDVSLDYYQSLKNFGINRISIGIQSFNDRILKFINRRHDRKAGINSIEFALKTGFTDISVDIIYGIPSQTKQMLLADLKLIQSFQIPHLSCYHLGIEEQTYFGKLKKSGKILDIAESKSEEFYKSLIDWTLENNYEHYEVSNFARNELYSKHNMAYWFKIPYIGLGPSAHSFINNKRYYNVSHILRYIELINTNKYFEFETLSMVDQLNEFIMLQLRTKWGINLNKLENLFPSVNFDNFKRSILKFKDSNYLRTKNNEIILSEKGMFVSDYIIRELFFL